MRQEEMKGYRDVFGELLRKAELTKREFSEISGVSLKTVYSWKSRNNLPSWVPWSLHNYIEASRARELKRRLAQFIK